MLLGVVTLLSTGVAVASSLPAIDAPPLQLKPKSAFAEVSPQTAAPFVHSPGTSEIGFRPQLDAGNDMGRSSCTSERAICYDAGSGRIEIKSARDLMPELPGLQRETISLKRDRLIFRYSF